MGRKNPKIEFSQLYIRNEDQELCKLKKLTLNFFQFEDGTKIGREDLRLNFTFYGVIDRYGFVIKYVKRGRVWAKEDTVAFCEEGKWVSLKDASREIVRKLNEMNDSTELSFYGIESFNGVDDDYRGRKVRRNLIAKSREEPVPFEEV